MEGNLYDNLTKGLYKIEDKTPSYEISPEQIASGSLLASFNQVMNVIQSGKTKFTNDESGYILGLDKGVAKFYIGTPTSYFNFDGTNVTLSGTLSAGAITIGTNAWHVDSSGNMWWGDSGSYAAATIKISAAGSINLTTGTFSGTLSAASGTLGAITIGTNAWHVDSSGNMWWGNYASYNDGLDKISGAGVWSRLRVSRTEAGTGYYYSNTSSVQNIGLDIAMGDSGGVTNSLPCIRMEMGGSGDLIQGTISGTGRGLLIQRSVGSSTANLIYLSSTNAAAGISILSERSSNGIIGGISLVHGTSSNSVNTGIIMDLTSGQANLCEAFRFNGSEKGITAAGNSGFVSNSTGTFTAVGYIRISISGSTYYMPYGTIA